MIIDILKKHSTSNKVDVKDIRIKICFNEDVINGVKSPKKILNYFLLNKGQIIKEMNFDEMVTKNILILPFKQEVEGFFVEILKNSYNQLKVINGEEGEEAKMEILEKIFENMNENSRKEFLKMMGLDEYGNGVIDENGIDISKMDIRILYEKKLGKDKKIKDGYTLFCFYNKSPMFKFDISFQQQI